jgi:hypothetical protein
MEKISVNELEEMIKSKFAEKGVTSEDLNEEMLKSITERIKSEVNSDVKNAPQNVEGDDFVDVDISAQNIEEPGEEPEAITSSAEAAAPDTEEVYKKEGELEERERAIAEKEEELKRKEEELERKKEEMEYEPTIPEKFQNMGSEKLFVFDENTLSAGSEKLSKLDMNIVDEPESKISMHDLWLKEGKRDAEVFVVKFEKVGNIVFNPFEGVSEFMSSSQEDIQTPTSTDDNESYENAEPSNMVDTIEPVKDVTQPMSDDMGLEVQSDESKADAVNIPEEDFEEVLNSKVKEIIKNYLSGQIVLGQKKND